MTHRLKYFLTLVLLFLISSTGNAFQVAEIIIDNAAMKVEPNGHSKTLEKLPRGTRVNIADKVDPSGFYKASSAKKQGWIRASSVSTNTSTASQGTNRSLASYQRNHKFSGSLVVGLPMGGYTLTSGLAVTNTTQQMFNGVEGGLSLFYYNPHTSFLSRLEYGLLAKLGSISMTAAALPLNWNLGLQIAVPDLIKTSGGTLSIAPLLRFQYDSLSIASELPALTGLEANTLKTYWVGIGSKFTFPNLLGLEIVPAFSYAVASSSLLSTTGTSWKQTGWKFDVSAQVDTFFEGRLIVGTKLLILNMSGTALINGLVDTVYLGTHF